ncbi:IS30 family transposase [Mycoplasmopsis gallinarum]
MGYKKKYPEKASPRYMSNYKRISFKMRAQIDFFLNKTQLSITQISRELNISRSTLINEIKINSNINGYDAQQAEIKHKNREKWKNQIKLRNQINKYSDFSKEFIKRFNNKYFGIKVTWKQIYYTYRNIKIPSLKTVFNWINSGLWIIMKNDRLHSHYVKGKKRKTSFVQQAFGKKWIRYYWALPKKVLERRDFGWWELDLVVGKSGSKHWHLLTFVERKTRYGLIKKIHSKDPWNVNKEIWNLIKKYKLNVKGIITDNGFEFKKIFYLAYRLRIYIYYTSVNAAFQKGSNENFNGLIRRTFKKGTNFDDIDEKIILRLQNTINFMPREIFDFQSSSELFWLWNYSYEKWKEIPENEELYIGAKERKRISNTKRNRFFKLYNK